MCGPSLSVGISAGVYLAPPRIANPPRNKPAKPAKPANKLVADSARSSTCVPDIFFLNILFLPLLRRKVVSVCEELFTKNIIPVIDF